MTAAALSLVFVVIVFLFCFSLSGKYSILYLCSRYALAGCKVECVLELLWQRPSSFFFYAMGALVVIVVVLMLL